MAIPIDSTAHYISFYLLNAIVLIEFFITIAGAWSTRHYPCMIKRRIELNFAIAIGHFILAQRSISFGFLNWSSIREDVAPFNLLLDICIITSIIPVNLGCGTFQLLLLLNDAHVSQLLLKESSKTSKQSFTEIEYFSKFDYAILFLFGVRRKVFQLGAKKTKYLDFSRSSIIRSLFILFISLFLLSVVFSILLFNFYDWDVALVARFWPVIWIYVIIVSMTYFIAFEYYVWKAKGIHDSYFIWKENFIKQFIYLICAIPPLVEPFSPEFQLIRNYGLTCALGLVIMIILAMPLSVLFCYYFLYSMDRLIKGLSVNLESFQSMFSNKHMWGKFKDLLAKDFCMENAFFVEEYDRIYNKEKCNKLAIPSSVTLESSSLNNSTTSPYVSSSIFIFTCNTPMDLYEVFIKSNAVYELNVSFKVKHAVSEIVQKGNILTVDDFHPVYLEVVNSM
ncbi:hypothetical protein HMI56_002934, partial [Coelomomyces lativittatus]